MEPWTFTMVTPDAMVGGYLGFALERLAAHGFTVRACRLIQLDFPRLARMYSHSDDPPPPSGGRNQLPETVMTPLYGIAPACVLSLHREAGDAPAAMLRCKGATLPAEAAPGTVRAAGEHAIFNFVHCPDDGPSAATELAYLVGAAEAEALRAADEPLAPLVGLDQLRAGLPAAEGWEALAFPLVANRLRHRVVQALALRTGPGGRPALLRAQAGLTAERSALLAADGVPARMAIAQAAAPAIHADLAAVACAAGDATLEAALGALNGLYDLDGPRDWPPLRGFVASGIYVSALEHVALDAHRHTFWTDAQPDVPVAPRCDA